MHTTVGDDPLREARVAVREGRFREAWERLDDLGKPVRRSPEWLLLAAVTHFRLGQFARCHAAGLQARDGFRAVGDADGEMRAENAAAVGAFALGRLDEAAQGFEKALTLARHLRDTFMTARCANNLGNVAYYRADYRRALSFYRVAATIFERLGFYGELALNWLNAAIVWREMGNLDESRDAADRAVAAAERAGDERVLGQALAAGAETSAALGDLELARAQITRALDLARRLDDPLAEADALRILSIVERLAGRLEPAETAGRNGLSIAEGLHHPWAEAEIRRDLGAVLAARGRRDEAAQSFDTAAEAFDRLGAGRRADSMRERARALTS